MAKDKRKKKFSIRKGRAVEEVPLSGKKDPLDDNDREQVLPFAERPEDLCDEIWNLPGDDEKPPGDIRQITARKDK